MTFLQYSTKALLASKGAVHLNNQKDRILQAIENDDPSLALDASRAFLESTFKTILQDRSGSEEIPVDFTQLFQAVRTSMPLSVTKDVEAILKGITSPIVHHVNELRKNFGAASHGNDGYYNCPVKMNDAYMIIQFVDGLVGFLLNRHDESSDPETAKRIHYNKYPEFNEFWDEQYDGHTLYFNSNEQFVIPASELLFKFDLGAYREALLQFNAGIEDDAEEVEDI